MNVAYVAKESLPSELLDILQVSLNNAYDDSPLLPLHRPFSSIFFLERLSISMSMHLHPTYTLSRLSSLIFYSQLSCSPIGTIPSPLFYFSHLVVMDVYLIIGRQEFLDENRKGSRYGSEI